MIAESIAGTIFDIGLVVITLVIIAGAIFVMSWYD
jgi:cbb3-type cytochrome oxidase subunit 3